VVGESALERFKNLGQPSVDGGQVLVLNDEHDNDERDNVAQGDIGGL
jgi:hypothetical protein